MGAENLTKVLEPEKVAALPMFQAWREITQNKPPDIYPRVELFNGWDFFSPPIIREDVFGRRDISFLRGEWLDYTDLARGRNNGPVLAADSSYHHNGWIPLFLALSQINHATVQDFIRRCLLPYELAYGVSLYSSFFLIRGSLHEYTRFLHI